MVPHVYISTVIHNPIFYIHISAHLTTDSSLTFLYILQEFFQKIRQKFDFWSNHFIWKDMLIVTTIHLLQEVQNQLRAVHKTCYAHHTIWYLHTLSFQLLITTDVNINIMLKCALNMTAKPMLKLASLHRILKCCVAINPQNICNIS